MPHIRFNSTSCAFVMGGVPDSQSTAFFCSCNPHQTNQRSQSITEYLRHIHTLFVVSNLSEMNFLIYKEQEFTRMCATVRQTEWAGVLVRRRHTYIDPQQSCFYCKQTVYDLLICVNLCVKYQVCVGRMNSTCKIWFRPSMLNKGNLALSFKYCAWRSTSTVINTVKVIINQNTPNCVIPDMWNVHIKPQKRLFQIFWKLLCFLILHSITFIRGIALSSCLKCVMLPMAMHVRRCAYAHRTGEKITTSFSFCCHRGTISGSHTTDIV